MNTTMKFPDQHFVTFSRIGPVDNRQKLGFLVPDGDDSAARKRKETAIRWGSKDIPHETHKNVPQHGFKIMTKVSRGGSWNGQQDKWRVMDPRGFILEIPAGNLEQILALTTIKEGVIEGECMWGREGAVNMLVPVNSELYVEAMKTTNTAKQATISIKLANVGDTVTFQNGEKHRYMGRLYLIYQQTDRQWIPTEKPFHVFDGYMAYANPKIVAIEPAATPMTQDDAVAEINAKLAGPAYCSIHTHGKAYYPKAVSAYMGVHVAYHREDRKPDYVPERDRSTFVEISGKIYRARQDYGQNRTMRSSFENSYYSIYEIAGINNPDVQVVANLGWSQRNLSAAQLDAGQYFTLRREFITTEGHYANTM